MSSKAPFPLLYEDAEFLIIDKPAGLAVHPGPKTPHSLEDHLDNLRLGYRRAPSPAHRLDRDTSGCLILARNPKTLKKMHALFEAKGVTKVYLALLCGCIDGEGIIDAPLTKISSREAGWRMVVHEGGKPSVTNWRTLKTGGTQSLVEFRPETGRTHQLRVHAAHALAPIVGDPVYGAAGEPMRLHASEISFKWRGRQISAAAPASDVYHA